MKGHLKHLAMCAPMLIVVAVLLATGTGLAVLVPVAACVLMMGVMMTAMGMAMSRRNGGH
jgi:hypothetical protein